MEPIYMPYPPPHPNPKKVIDSTDRDKRGKQESCTYCFIFFLFRLFLTLDVLSVVIIGLLADTILFLSSALVLLVAAATDTGPLTLAFGLRTDHGHLPLPPLPLEECLPWILQVTSPPITSHTPPSPGMHISNTTHPHLHFSGNTPKPRARLHSSSSTHIHNHVPTSVPQKTPTHSHELTSIPQATPTHIALTSIPQVTPTQRATCSPPFLR